MITLLTYAKITKKTAKEWPDDFLYWKVTQQATKELSAMAE